MDGSGFKSESVTFLLNCPAFSINKLYYATKKSRTQDARNWSALVFQEMAMPYNNQQLMKFKGLYDPKTMAIGLNLTFRFPEAILFNKSGTLSSRAPDCSNIEKPLQDLLFEPRFNDRPVPMGAPNLEMNDKFVTDLNSKRRVGTHNSILVTLYTIDLKEVRGENV